ncbi:unnamed protein product, partial [Rotaria magnacalcarata]
YPFAFIRPSTKHIELLPPQPNDAQIITLPPPRGRVEKSLPLYGDHASSEATNIPFAQTSNVTYDNSASNTTLVTYATITSSLTLTRVSQADVVAASTTSVASIAQLTTTESPSSSTNFIGSIGNNTYPSTLATNITMVAQDTFETQSIDSNSFTKATITIGETTTVAESNVKNSTDENNSIVIITTTESQSTSSIPEPTGDSSVNMTSSTTSKVTESEATSQFEGTDHTYIKITANAETLSTSTVATFTFDASNSDHSSISSIVRTDEATIQTQIDQGTSVIAMTLSESMISSTPANSMLETIVFTSSPGINATTATARDSSTDKTGIDSSLSTVSMVDSLISSTVVTNVTQTSNDIFSSTIIPTRQYEITSKSQANENTLMPTTTVVGDIISLSSQTITIDITVSTPEFSTNSTINSSTTFDDLTKKDTSITSMTITQSLISTVIPASIEDTFTSYSTSSSSIIGDTETTAQSQTYENTSLPSDTIVASMILSTTLVTAISTSSLPPENRLTPTAQYTTTMSDQTTENLLISTIEANENSSSLTSEFSTINIITSSIIPSRSAGIISNSQTTRTFDGINSSSTLPSMPDTTSTLVSSSTASNTLAAETTFDIATSGQTLNTNTMIRESNSLVTTTRYMNDTNTYMGTSPNTAETTLETTTAVLTQQPIKGTSGISNQPENTPSTIYITFSTPSFTPEAQTPLIHETSVEFSTLTAMNPDRRDSSIIVGLTVEATDVTASATILGQSTNKNEPSTIDLTSTNIDQGHTRLPTVISTSEIISNSIPPSTKNALTSSVITAPTSTLFTTTTTTTTYTPDLCRNSTQVALSNGTCVSYGVGQEYAATLINSVNTSAIDLANALPLYISSAVNSNLSSISNNTVSPSKINEVVENVNNISIVVNSGSSLLIVQEINRNAQQVVVGASFQRGSGGSIVSNTTQDSTLNGNFSAAALISTESLVNIQSLTMFIIDNPTMYESIGNA